MKLGIAGTTDRGTVFLKLEQDGNGISVVACDSKGNHREAGYLVRFNPDGTLMRWTSVESGLGFSLNCEGQIEIEGIDDDC